MSTIIDNYEVNVVVYEVSGKSNVNATLYKRVGKRFNFDAATYPFMVIGEETFDGYSSEDDENIKDTLKKFVDMETHYDVVEDVGNVSENLTSQKGIVFVFIFGVVLVLGLVMGYQFLFKI